MGLSAFDFVRLACGESRSWLLSVRTSTPVCSVPVEAIFRPVVRRGFAGALSAVSVFVAFERTARGFRGVAFAPDCLDRVVRVTACGRFLVFGRMDAVS
jgi:hypothetical protein